MFTDHHEPSLVGDDFARNSRTLAPLFLWDRSCMGIKVNENARPVRTQLRPLPEAFMPCLEHGCSNLNRCLSVGARGPFRLFKRVQSMGEIPGAPRRNR